MANREISIRSVQHFLYCAHRWGMLEIDCAWAENYFVTKASLLHQRVHNPENNYSVYGKKTYTSVSVYNDREEYNLYGITDCIEIRNNNPNDICIVEYKPTKPKNRDFNEDDLMQVFAQKICVDYVFGCDCDAVLYYADVKKRVKLPLRENFKTYDELLRNTLREMRSLLAKGEIPAISKSQNCSGCSMRDMCMPSLKIKKSVKEYIADVMENNK